MPTIEEARLGQGTPLSADLKAGVENISYNQTVTFTKYIKLILPLDGYVFWVRADQVSTSALIDAAQFNAIALNQPQVEITPAATITARGSLHYASNKVQDETESYGINRVVFTAEDRVIQDFNQVGPHCIFIGEFEGIKFAFSNTKNFYRQASLWHYYGDAIYPFMETQIVDKVTGFNSRNVIVSNSLPLWLHLNNYQPFYGFGNQIPLYPSHLVQPNVRPPFASVHIEGTEAIASAPFLTRRSSHFQLVKEKVRIVVYGLHNYDAMNLLDCILQFSADYGSIGMMNSPVIKDEKKGQNELYTIAMKKSIDFEVSYHQEAARDIVRQIICRSIPEINMSLSTTEWDFIKPVPPSPVGGLWYYSVAAMGL